MATGKIPALWMILFLQCLPVFTDVTPASPHVDDDYPPSNEESHQHGVVTPRSIVHSGDTRFKCVCQSEYRSDCSNDTCMALRACFAAIVKKDDGRQFIQKGCFDGESHEQIMCRISSDTTIAIACCDTPMCNENLEPKLEEQPRQAPLFIIITISVVAAVAILTIISFVLCVAWRRHEQRMVKTHTSSKRHVIYQGGLRVEAVGESTLWDMMSTTCSSGSGSGLPLLVQSTVARQIALIECIGLAVIHKDNTIDIKKNNNRVGTKRYMAPEVLDESINAQNFDSFKQADVYAFGLVLWEVARRCVVGGIAEEYKPPFYDVVGHDPSFDEMRKIVCDDEYRPVILNRWHSDATTSVLANLMKEMWSMTPSTRLTMLRVKKTILKAQHNITPIEETPCNLSGDRDILIPRNDKAQDSAYSTNLLKSGSEDCI